MDKIFDKLNSYNILNNIIPGSMFCYLLQYVCGIDLLRNSVVENLFIYYFVGMVMSRFGSLILEPIVIKLKIVNYAHHSDYIVASQKDKKIDLLLETNNLYRTIAMSGLLIILIKIYTILGYRISFLPDATPYLIGVILFVLFLLSFRKQTGYIRKRVNQALQNENKTNTEEDKS